MDIPAELLPAAPRWLAFAAYLTILLVAARRAEWWRLRDPGDSHVFLGACVAVLAVWLLRVGIAPGLHLHLLGIVLLTLMFGWRFAVLGSALVLAATTWNHGSGLSSIGVNGLATTVLPVASCWLVLKAMERHLAPNLFVYVFVAGFFNAGLALLTVGGASSIVLWLSGAYTFDYVLSNYTVFYMLLAFPEAFLTGGLISIFVAFRPEWVATFQDSRYLHSPGK